MRKKRLVTFAQPGSGTQQPWKQIVDLTNHCYPACYPDAESPATSYRRKFYHGTQTPIHLLANPYLDPAYAHGGDLGDPIQPHVFVTPNKLLAKVFSLKTSKAMYIAENEIVPTIVFCSEPRDTHGGWVYTCLDDPANPFEEVIVRGRHTDKWVSYSKTPISEAEYVAGLEQLIRENDLQVLVLKEGITREEWKKDCDLNKCRLWLHTGGQ